MDPVNTEIRSDRAVDQAITQTVEYGWNDISFLSQDGVQGAFYTNILAWWLVPTVIAICIIVLWNILETWTFFGFLVPVDVLLFTSGTILWANERWRSALFMLVFCITSTTVWDLLWYWWAGKLGDTLYDRPDTRYFKKKYLYNAQAYFEKYSEKALYIWRFTVIGSFLPMLAGVAKMNIVRFIIHSMLSATIRTLATFVPSLLLWFIWPGITTSRRLVALWFMVFTMTEMAAWFILFNKDIKQIAVRIRESHQKFAEIKVHAVAITNQVGDIADYVVKWDESSKQVDTKIW